MRKAAKRFGFVLLGLLTFLILLVIYTQTPFFRNQLKTYLLGRLDSALVADVFIGRIDGNLITTFSLDSVSIVVDGAEFLAASRIDVRFDPLQLLRDIVDIEHISLVSPRVAFASRNDGTWNFDRIMRPSTGDTAGGGSEWEITIRNLLIENGTVSLVDSAALAAAGHPTPDPYFVEYHDFRLEHVQLQASANLRRDEKHAVITKLAFRSDRPSVELLLLAGEFQVTGSEATIRGMKIVTSESQIELDAGMKDVNLFEPLDLASMKKHPVELRLRESRISFPELKRFLPELAFTGSEAGISLEAGGEFGELEIRRLDLSSGRTALHGKGWVYSLDNPSELYLDVEFANSTLYPPDVLALLPGLDLPDYEHLGQSTFDLGFRGKPLDFTTQFYIATNEGDVDGEVSLMIGGPEVLSYQGTVSFGSLNLASVLKDESLASMLNGSAVIEGRGIQVRQMNAEARVSLDSSMFLGRRLSPSQLALKAAGDSVEANLSLGLGSMKAEIFASVDHTENPYPDFTISGTMAGLNLEELLGDTSYNSDLNMHIVAEGTGLSWSDVSGDFKMDFLSSRFREYHVDSAGVLLSVDQRNGAEKNLSIESSMADFSLTGLYDIEYLAGILSFEIQNVSAAIHEKFAVLDSSGKDSQEEENLIRMREELSQQKSSLDARFHLSIKDLEPLSILTQNRVFNGVGTLEGSLSGSIDDLSLHAGLEARELFYGDVESGFLIQEGSIRLDVNNLKPVRNPLPELELRFLTTADNLHINRSQFDSLSLSVRYEQGYASYTAGGKFGEELRFAINGLANVSEDLLVFTLNEVRVAYEDLAWGVDGGSTVGFGPRGARLRNVIMRSDTQVVVVNGFLGIDGEIEGMLVAENIGLNNLRYFQARESSESAAGYLAGAASITLKVEGTSSDPVFEASVDARAVSLRGLPFGEIEGTIDYEKGIMTTHLQVVDPSKLPGAKPRLIVDGTIPFGARADAASRIAMTVQSEGIEIGILDPLISTFTDLSGTLRCNLKVQGTADDLQYSGSITLDGCRFVFTPNNIPYLFSGQFEPKGDRITVVDAVVRNVPADERPGKRGLMRINGDFALKNFVPTDFNLRASGELLIVKQETRRSSLSVYGDLYVEVGSGGLRFLGTIDHSILRGHVLVRSSSLVFPPTGTRGTQTSDYSIPIIVIDDTSTVVELSVGTFKERYFQTGEPSRFSHLQEREEPKRKSFTDGLEYDLQVETSGAPSEIKLVFSTVPREELQANFQGKWTITNDGKRWIGVLNIDRAYYFFYKQFDATGRLRYSGEFLNPELDIDAQYQGTRTVLNATDSTSRTERVVVNLRITGTRMAPHDSISMTIDGVDYYSYSGLKSSDVESDALSFILAGNFPLSSSQSSSIASDLQQTVGASLVVGASSVLTSQLSDFLRRETGFISSVELGYGSQGASGEAADIRLSGTAFKGLWRYRGTLSDSPLSSSNFSLLYSFGDIFDTQLLRNFMLELERSSEIGQLGLVDETNEINSARLFYRFSF